jgi:hypothetical protein
MYNSIKEHSWNYGCLGKEIRVEYYECVLCILAEVIGHADHIFVLCYIAICGPSVSAIFCHNTS